LRRKFERKKEKKKRRKKGEEDKKKYCKVILLRPLRQAVKKEIGQKISQKAIMDS